MATGKSTVGRTLAHQLGLSFLDLDELVTRRAQASIEQIFAERGEAAFRNLERKVLRELLEQWAERPVVVALGGGALLDRETRIFALSQSVVVCLSASAGEITRRARFQEGEKGARPLLAGSDPETRIHELLEARAEIYGECHGTVHTDGRTPAEIAEEVLGIGEEDSVVVAAGKASYCVTIGALLDERRLIEQKLPGRIGHPSGALVVSDQNVAPLHGAAVRKAFEQRGISPALVELIPGEEHKNLDGLRDIYQAAFDARLDRQGLLVGLGGGVVTDMTGFAAATWMRGVRWIGLPTTLLSMVDASVGGKTGIDFLTAKNCVGAFWQPSAVICDVDTLRTESERMYVGALSEVVKTALIGDPRLFSLLEESTDAVIRRDPRILQEIVQRSVRVKARVVSLDEREMGLRATLNLGHTWGHALESSGGYTALTHGEAVSLGLVAALRFGEKRGKTHRELTQRVIALLRGLGLPYELSAGKLARASALVGHDKKRAGTDVRFVFAQDVGDVTTEKVSLSEVVEAAPELATPAPAGW